MRFAQARGLAISEPIHGAERMAVMLYLNNRPMQSAESLEEAKKKAELFITGRPEVCIERTEWPAPVQAWIYDCELRQWVEQR